MKLWLLALLVAGFHGNAIAQAPAPPLAPGPGVILPLAPPPLAGMPPAPTVVSGTVSFNRSPSVLTVTTSNGAMINWNNFSIPAGGTIQFAQPSASSAVLNRIITTSATPIVGRLTSNGRVFFLNTAGIIVTPGGGRLNPATLVAPKPDFSASTANLPPAPAVPPLTPRGSPPVTAPVNSIHMADGAVTLRTPLVDASPIVFR